MQAIVGRVCLHITEEHLASHGATFASLKDLLIWLHTFRHLLKQRQLLFFTELQRRNPPVP